jgi:Mn-dependent DtxR family transcriptional regulator
VWVIRGDLVRDFYFIDFTEGGHDKVYHFVPEKEVWLDDDLNPRERKFVLLHELHERHLMSQGWPYHKAHRSASEIEHYCRIHLQEIDKKLRIEIDRNK